MNVYKKCGEMVFILYVHCNEARAQSLCSIIIILLSKVKKKERERERGKFEMWKVSRIMMLIIPKMFFFFYLTWFHLAE